MDVEFKMMDRDSNWYRVPVSPPTSVFSSMISIVSDHNIFCASCVISFLTFLTVCAKNNSPSFPQVHDQPKKNQGTRGLAQYLSPTTCIDYQPAIQPSLHHRT